MMSRVWVALLFGSLLARPSGAQGERHLIPSDDALTKEVCEELVRRVRPGIERFTRMKFRRHIPVRIEPKVVWMNKAKAGGVTGFSGRHALAFYRPSINDITIVPWTMGYDHVSGEAVRKRTREEWIMEVEPTVIHELTHGIHHQNFFTSFQNYGIMMRTGGFSDEELDVATVSFLLGEGFAEFVSLRTTAFRERMNRHPNPELSHGRFYMRTYQPTGKEPYRITLSKYGYQHGLDLLHHLSLKAGPRAVRGILYRQPPRQLLFQPHILAKAELDDPPEPDSIFGELYPSPSMADVEIKLAVNPGHGRYFSGAYRIRTERARGCLIGYVAEADGPDGGTYRYAMFVSHPDESGDWSKAQAASLRALEGGEASTKKVPLPLAPGVEATVIRVHDPSGGLYVRAEAEGLVILAHESKPTERLEDRVVAALRVLYIKKPTEDLYKELLKAAKAELDKTDD